MMSSLSEKSQLPTNVAFVLGFLTIGVGALRSVGAFELFLRAVVVSVVSSVAVRILLVVWKTSEPDA